MTFPAQDLVRASTSLPEEVSAGMQEAYLADARPWVVAFSGGKDSTLVLQLVYEVLISLGEQATKPVYVLSSDTRVEAPNVVAYIEQVLNAIREDAVRRNLPLTTHLVRPRPEETFWAKLIGKGYPPPTRWFRWCTTSMKIKPSRRKIDEWTGEHGSVILLLGSRRAESTARRTRMDGRRRNARDLNPHHEIPNAFVMTPIADWRDEEVWEFLYSRNPPPWGFSHDTMLGLYRQAVGGECPVVMDLSTPSCGGSRFGCWTCTVVKEDRSMAGFLQTGDAWMEPLAAFRNKLKAMREDKSLRAPRRRDGSEGVGPFLPTVRRRLLEDLLAIEQTLGLRLIGNEDIAYVQKLWSAEFDLKDSALTMARDAGRSIAGGIDAVPLNEDDRALLHDLAAQAEIDESVIDRILELEAEFPNLDAWGIRPQLKNRIAELIEAAAGEEGALE